MFGFSLGLCAVLSTNAQAEQHPTTNYLSIKRALTDGDELSRYHDLRNTLLYPYLAVIFLKNRLDDDASIIALITTHYDAPPIKSLHNRWIVHKYEQGDYQTIIQHYYHTGNQAANCAYRSALLAVGNRQAALDNIDTIWMSAKPVSPLCDNVFATWQGSKQSDNIVKRATLAYHANQYGLVSRLAKTLPITEPQQQTLLQFADYLQNPQNLLLATKNSLTQSALARELLPTALSALVRIDSSHYASFAMQFATTLKDNARYQTMLASLTEYLVNRGDTQSQQVYDLLTHPDNKTTEALLRYLVGNRDWQAILKRTAHNSESSMQLYWRGRALEATGKEAKNAYRKAMEARSYYGFLAADKLGKSYQFNEHPITPDTVIQAQLNGNTALMRAKSLARYGESLAARREIFVLVARMGFERQRQLAYWLNRHGFYFEAIYTLGKARDWNDIRIRFPLPYNNAVEHAYTRTGTDKTWIYAIMRQETSMNANAVSRSKAKGLMQLIPSTARMMGRDQDLPTAGDNIFNPMINVQLGAAYLAQMYERFGNVAQASAGYNAGPNRIDEWLARDSEDMTIWVEKIPFNETRKYVKRVLEYQQVYAKLLGITIPNITTRLMQLATQTPKPTGSEHD